MNIHWIQVLIKAVSSKLQRCCLVSVWLPCTWSTLKLHPYFRTMTFWIRGSTASASRQRVGRTCSSAWNWIVSCWSGKRLFRWPLSWRWRGYRCVGHYSDFNLAHRLNSVISVQRLIMFHMTAAAQEWLLCCCAALVCNMLLSYSAV